MSKIPVFADREVVIRNADPNDAEAVQIVAVSARIDAWTANQYAEETLRSDAVFLIAEGHLGMSGFVMGRIVPGSENGFDGEIYNIAVIGPEQRNGIGRKLLSASIERFAAANCRSVWLEVRAANYQAIQFYQNNGFTAYGLRPKFYSGPADDAIVMRLTLERMPSIDS